MVVHWLVAVTKVSQERRVESAMCPLLGVDSRNGRKQVLKVSCGRAR